MTPCPLCGSGESAVFALFHNVAYRRCRACGLVYADGPRDAARSGAAYDAEYISRRGHDLPGSSIAKAKQATAARYLALLERHAPKGRLLEIGCSTGIALKAAAARGWEVYGLDVNEAAVAEALALPVCGKVQTNPAADVGGASEE